MEYDEKFHKRNKIQDDERIEFCISWLAEQDEDKWRCPCIRIKEGDEFEGLNRIVRHFAGFEMFDTQWNYKNQVCDKV